MAAETTFPVQTVQGTAALCIVADDETGEISSADILGQFCDMPNDFLDQLRGDQEAGIPVKRGGTLRVR